MGPNDRSQNVLNSGGIMTTTKRVVFVSSMILVAAVVYQWGHSNGSAGRALGLLGVSLAAEESTGQSATELDVYYPGTEPLAPDEMRVVALGTGQPSPRPKQAASCWLVELGNGDKFLFDIGAGCHERLAAQKIPYDYLDKVFLGHLHVDHFGDLASFWLGGTTMNRLVPLRIWGPSGATPEYGTAAALARLKEAYVWDIGTRSGFIDARGMELQVTEFPYDGARGSRTSRWTRPQPRPHSAW